MTDKFITDFVNIIEIDSFDSKQVNFVDALIVGVTTLLSWHLTDLINHEMVTIMTPAPDRHSNETVIEFIKHSFNKKAPKGIDLERVFYLLVYPKISLEHGTVVRLEIRDSNRNRMDYCYIHLSGYDNLFQVNFDREWKGVLEAIENGGNKRQADFKRLTVSKDFKTSLQSVTTLRNIFFGFHIKART